jgi:hypothetical protein
MEFSDKIIIKPSLSTSYTATITMQVKDSFRWIDANGPSSDYNPGIFDAEQDGTTETVTGISPASYSIVVE